MSRIRADFAAEIEDLASVAAQGLGAGTGGLPALETAIRTAMTVVGCSLLEGLLAADTGHRGPRIDCGSGHRAGFVSYRPKTIDTVLGPVRLSRAYYHCPQCRTGVVPRDGDLDVAGLSLSGGLRKMTASTGAAVPFNQAATLIEDLAGITLTTKRVERAAEAAGTGAAKALHEGTDAILTGRIVPLPPPGPAPDKLYIGSRRDRSPDDAGRNRRPARQRTRWAGPHP